jgi:tetratricopeptide (TPR) repeat protein
VDYNVALAVGVRAYSYMILKESYADIISDGTYIIDAKLTVKAEDVEIVKWLGYYLRGRAYLATKEYGKAINDFTQAIKNSPNDLYSYYYRAQSYMENQEYDKARADNNYVQQKDPDFNAARFQEMIINWREMMQNWDARE